MANILIINILCGYHDYDYYDKLAKSSEDACLEIMMCNCYYKFLTIEEKVRRQYDKAWKLRNELKLKDIRALSDESLELLADLILEDCLE